MTEYFTIGYGGRTPDEFVTALRDAGVTIVADVRLRPDKAHLGAFVQAKDPAKGIEGMLARAGIRYVSLIELGNPFLGRDDWKERYRRLMTTSGELLLERLLEIDGSVCLLCAEKRHEDCHRSVIADTLTARGNVVRPL